MKVKYLAYAVIFVMTVSILWAQENKQQEKTPPPATTSQPAPTPAAQAPATGTEAVPAPAVPHGFTISPEEAARKNPVRFSEISVERGKKIFQTQCVMCHGEKGDGKGETTFGGILIPFDNSRELEKGLAVTLQGLFL